MEIVHIGKQKYISTRDARNIMGNCSNTTLFNRINHFKAFKTKKVGAAVLVEVASFKKFCKKQGYNAEALS